MVASVSEFPLQPSRPLLWIAVRDYCLSASKGTKCNIRYNLLCSVAESTWKRRRIACLLILVVLSRHSNAKLLQACVIRATNEIVIVWLSDRRQWVDEAGSAQGLVNSLLSARRLQLQVQRRTATVN